MSLDDLPLRHVLNETADVYEILAALPPTASTTGGRRPGKPGSKVPPGVGELLDIEEHERAISTVDDWATYLARHLIDITPGAGALSDTTPGRLRFAASWADKLEDEPDLFARYAFRYDAVENLRMLRRLVRRGNRVVRVPRACPDITCSGHFTAIIDGPETDSDLVCSVCGWRIPWDSWSQFARNDKYISIEQAAKMLGTTMTATRKRASRAGWTRKIEGGAVRYLAADVRESGGVLHRAAG